MKFNNLIRPESKLNSVKGKKDVHKKTKLKLKRKLTIKNDSESQTKNDEMKNQFNENFTRFV